MGYLSGILRSRFSLLLLIAAVIPDQALAQTPTLTSISPTSLSPGMQATLSGSGFGANTGSVQLQNQTNVPIVSWSDTQIVVTVPAGTIPGHASVYRNGVYSNYVSFTMIPATLSSISPTSLSPGMQATLTGSGFGANTGSVQLQNQTNVPIVSWSDTQIVVTVPAGTIPGHASVYRNGIYSNVVSFTISPLSITSVSPTSGVPGTHSNRHRL
jgi:IPT/TIG domain